MDKMSSKVYDSIFECCIMCKDKKLSSILEKYGKEIDINKPNSNYETPLILACKYPNVKIISLLLNCSGIDVNKSDNSGITPLMLLCNHEYESDICISSVRLLLEHPDIDVNRVDDSWWDALKFACSNDYKEIVREILLRDDVDINKTDNDGWNVLMLCCLHNNEEIFDMIVSYGNFDINSINMTGFDGKSAMYIACTFGYIGIVEKLLQMSVNIDKYE